MSCEEYFQRGVLVGLQEAANRRKISIEEAVARELKRIKSKRISGEVFLRTREWVAVRDAFIATAVMRCTICGAEERLVVDHVKSRKRHPELALTPSNLQILCWRCNMDKADRRAT